MYRVGGYETAKSQIFTICGWSSDVEIVKTMVGESRVEEGAGYATNAVGGVVSGAAQVATQVATVTLSFRCVDQEDGRRGTPRILPHAPHVPEVPSKKQDEESAPAAVPES